MISSNYIFLFIFTIVKEKEEKRKKNISREISPRQDNCGTSFVVMLIFSDMQGLKPKKAKVILEEKCPYYLLKCNLFFLIDLSFLYVFYL